MINPLLEMEIHVRVLKSHTLYGRWYLISIDDMTRDDEQWERSNRWPWKQFHQDFFIGIFIEAKAVPSICFFWNLLLFQIRFCTARYLIVTVTLFPSKCVYLYQPKIDEKLKNWEKSSLRSSPNPESMTQHAHQGPEIPPCKLNAMFCQACLCHPRTWSWTQWPRSNEAVRFKLPSGEAHRKWRILPGIPGNVVIPKLEVWTSTFFWRNKVFLKNRQHMWEFPTSGLFCYHLQKIDSENMFFAGNCPISPPFLALVRPWFSLTDQWNLPLKSGWKIVASLKRDFCC